MLRLLKIRNFAIIDELELEFEGGLNAITGETGAGKSIILDAIGLILGNRASSELIRAGSDEATVEALSVPHQVVGTTAAGLAAGHAATAAVAAAASAARRARAVSGRPRSRSDPMRFRAGRTGPDPYPGRRSRPARTAARARERRE